MKSLVASLDGYSTQQYKSFCFSFVCFFFFFFVYDDGNNVRIKYLFPIIIQSVQSIEYGLENCSLFNWPENICGQCRFSKWLTSYGFIVVSCHV